MEVSPEGVWKTPQETALKKPARDPENEQFVERVNNQHNVRGSSRVESFECQLQFKFSFQFKLKFEVEMKQFEYEFDFDFEMELQVEFEFDTKNHFPKVSYSSRNPLRRAP